MELALIGGIFVIFTLAFTQVILPAWNSIEDDIILRETYLTFNSFRAAPLEMNAAGSLEAHTSEDFLQSQLDQIASSLEMASGHEACVAIFRYESSPLICNPYNGSHIFGAVNPSACQSVEFGPGSCLGNAVSALLISSGCSSEGYFLAVTPADESLRHICTAQRLEASSYRIPQAISGN